MNTRRLNIVVTVGMGPWPFDRLLESVAPLCADHDVFAQTGTSSVVLPCKQSSFVSYAELIERLQNADIVITHAGNTVRLVQRMGKVPVTVARESARGEMADDHQVAFLRDEELRDRIFAVWNSDEVPTAALRCAQERRSITPDRLPPPSDPRAVAELLDIQWMLLRDNPFRGHPIRRYAYAWSEIVDPTYDFGGPHLDIGCNTGEFLATLAASTDRVCRGVDVHPDYVAEARERYPELDIDQAEINRELPYPSGSFGSITLLDVLEHCPDDDAMLAEINRLLRPGGLLVLTVPAKHMFSFLDPDNVKYRLPRVHRLVYSTRFGKDRYLARFVDESDGMHGDISIERGEHTNYRPVDLAETTERHGFRIRRQSGANRLWRLLHGPALLAGGHVARQLDRAILLDGRLFHDANLFLTLTKVA